MAIYENKSLSFDNLYKLMEIKEIERCRQQEIDFVRKKNPKTVKDIVEETNVRNKQRNDRLGIRTRIGGPGGTVPVLGGMDKAEAGIRHFRSVGGQDRPHFVSRSNDLRRMDTSLKPKGT